MGGNETFFHNYTGSLFFIGPTITSVVNLIGLLEDIKILQMHTAKTNL